MSMDLTFSDWWNYTDSDSVAYVLGSVTSGKLAYPYLEAIRQAYAERQVFDEWVVDPTYSALGSGLGAVLPWAGKVDTTWIAQLMWAVFGIPSMASSYADITSPTVRPTFEGADLNVYDMGLWWFSGLAGYASAAAYMADAGISDADVLNLCNTWPGIANVKHVSLVSKFVDAGIAILRELNTFFIPFYVADSVVNAEAQHFKHYVIVPTWRYHSDVSGQTGTWHINNPSGADMELCVHDGTSFTVLATLSGVQTTHVLTFPAVARFPCIRAAASSGFTFR